MDKKTSYTAATVVTAMAVGAAAYMMSQPNKNKRQQDLKKSASTAIKNAGVIVDSISQMLG